MHNTTSYIGYLSLRGLAKFERTSYQCSFYCFSILEKLHFVIHKIISLFFKSFRYLQNEHFVSHKMFFFGNSSQFVFVFGLDFGTIFLPARSFSLLTKTFCCSRKAFRCSQKLVSVLWLYLKQNQRIFSFCKATHC